MDNNIISVSICSPVHNEKENILDLIEGIHNVITPLYGSNWEQILIDDGSDDGSDQLIEKLRESYPNVILYKHQTNMGERAAWSTAFNMAKGEVVVFLAADLQSQPEDIPRLLDLIFQEGFDVGTGSRRRRKDGFYYWLATRILNLYMSFVFQLPVRDVSSSFFAVRSKVIKNLSLVENDHRYILAILKKRGARIKEIPVEHRPRIAGRSHYTRWKVFWAIPEVFKFSSRSLKGFYDIR